MFKTGFDPIDKTLWHMTGACLMTGDASFLMARIFEGLMNDGHGGNILVFGDRTASALERGGATKALIEKRTVRHQADSFLDYWDQRLTDLSVYLASNWGMVDAIFVFPGRPILACSQALTSKYISTKHSRTVFHWCDGKIGSPEPARTSGFGFKNHYDVHINAQRSSDKDNEYDIEMDSFKDSRSGRHRIVIPKQATVYDAMSLNDVNEFLYDIANGTAPSGVAGKVGHILKRYKTLTGKDKPGFMK